MSTDKQRVTLYLTKSKYERAKALVARMPGSSVSALVDDLLDEVVDAVGALLNAAAAGDKDAQAEAFAMLLGNQMLRAAGESAEIVRRIKATKEEE